MISSSLSLVSRSASLWIILIRVASGPHALALRCPSYELIAVRTPAPPHPPHRPHLFCTPPVPPAPPATFRIQDSHKFSHSREISRFETCRNIAHPAPRTPRCFIGTSQTTESFNFSPTTKMREKKCDFSGFATASYLRCAGTPGASVRAADAPSAGARGAAAPGRACDIIL